MSAEPTQEDSNVPPKFSILIASHNRLELLKPCLESACAQEYSNFEVIVVDDGSGNETREYLKQQIDTQKHQNLRVIFAEHGGVARARARGVDEAEGEFVCILDSDDMLRANALARVAESFAADRKLEITYCYIEESLIGGKSFVRRYPRFRSAEDMLRATLIRPVVPFKHSGTCMRRSTLLALGSYDISLSCKIDTDLYLRFLRANHLPHLIEEPLVRFRMHKNNISHNRVEGIKVWWVLIERYGPRNKILRSSAKAMRAAAELGKWLYLEIKSRV